MRYQAALADGTDLMFLGVEAASEHTAPGTVTWSLGRDRWRELAALPDGTLESSVAQVAWTWFDECSGNPVGDFRVAACTALSQAPQPEGDFRVTANAYQDFHRAYAGGDTVSLVPYDPAWPAEYERFAGWLRDALGPSVVRRVEHIGSTAIPGMPAKPIIDVLVETPGAGEEARRVAIARLNSPEWEYWRYDDHEMFVKRDGFMGRRTHHVHMGPAGTQLWERVAFRDHLRSNPAAAAAYAALKVRLASERESDREGYTQAKGAFVREVTRQALAERTTGS